MGTAVILAMLLGAVGPLLLPFAYAKAGRGPVYAFCLTNLITLLPMLGVSLWARVHLPPTCRERYPTAPCDGIPYDAVWIFINALFVLVAIWSLMASAAIVTSPPFRK